jgi:tetratricopeptide (TPR) repeat protein
MLIEDWDFNWQDEYQYETPVLLPAGTRLTMRYTFDNSAENPRNPQVPPRTVRFGNRSLDEMATLTLQVLPESADARGALVESVCRHRVEQFPGTWTARLNLGAILAEQGKFAEAATHLRAGLALEPGSVDLHMNLGGVLASLDELEEARRCFEEALRLAPENPSVHANLALLEERLGRWEAAAQHYRAVLASNPRDGRAHRGLGSALLRLERLSEAASSCQQALAADPRDHEAHYLLGRIAFRQGRLEEATAALLAGLEIHPSAGAHADLAKVYAARGLEAEAAQQLEQAERLAGRTRR